MWILGLKGLNRADTDNSVELWLHLRQNRSVVTRWSLYQLSLSPCTYRHGRILEFFIGLVQTWALLKPLKCFPPFLTTVASTLPDSHIRSLVCDNVKSSSLVSHGCICEGLSGNSASLFLYRIYWISTAGVNKFSRLKCGAYSKAAFIGRSDATKNCINYGINILYKWNRCDCLMSV